MNQLRYRSDLEGLRAVAILAVVAAHAGVPWLAGGFVGVDVFFVLSGYLITGLLVHEQRTQGRINFAAFYARRFRRLLPALLVMLAITGILGRLLLSPSDQPTQAVSAAASAVWLSNFHFAFSNLGYFSPSADTNLYLHTWSLGVEEQFYLIWPALLMLAVGRPATKCYAARRLRAVMLVVLGTSLLACVLLTPYSPLVAFYLMPTRAWQFAVGALAFLWFGGLAVDKEAVRSASPAKTTSIEISTRFSVNHWKGWLGLSLIAAAAVGFNKHMLYPGFWSLVPTVGAALIVIAGARTRDGGVSTLLSLRPMQAIGRASYAWYLWHWPMLLFGAAIVDSPSWLQRFSWVVLSLILAGLSYRFVEAPFRCGLWVRRPARTLLLGAVGLMVCANALAIVWYNDAYDRMGSPDQLRYLKARSDLPAIYAMGCDDLYHSASVRACTFGPNNAEHTAVVMGDSVGLQWFPALTQVFDRPGWRLLVITKSSCPMVDEPIFYARIGREYTECAQWRKEALTRVAALKPDIVILGSTFTYDFGQAQWIDGAARVIAAISATSGHIDILRSTPALPFDGPACLAPRSTLQTVLAGDDRCTYPLSDSRADAVFGWLQQAAARFSNASVIDMNYVVCPAGQCRAELDGMITFRDSQHLSAHFAKSLAPVLAKRLNLERNP